VTNENGLKIPASPSSMSRSACPAERFTPSVWDGLRASTTPVILVVDSLLKASRLGTSLSSLNEYELRMCEFAATVLNATQPLRKLLVEADFKVSLYLSEDDLEELKELAERRDCPPVVVKLIKEIEMWKEEA
jgi:hypothetical protein